MFTKYVYDAGASLSEILADITLLLTGPGTDIVIDGDFGTAGLTDWTLGAGWSDGTGKASKDGAGVGTLTQAVAIPAVAGQKYRITYTVKDWTVGGVTVTYGGQSDTEQTADVAARSFDVTASTTGSLIITPSGDTTRLSIDDVIVQPLSGITDKALLSASCTPASTTITSTAATTANWFVHDAVTGTSNQTVFKALNQDGSTYKYMMIDLSSAGYLHTIVGESWDAGANTWTNKASGSDTAANSQQMDTTNGGTLFIGATSKYCIVWSYKGGVYGSSTGYAPCGIFERTRAAGWDTAGAGYPPFVYANWYNIGSATSISTTLNALAPRLKGLAGDKLTTAAFLHPVVEWGLASTFRGGVPLARAFDSSLNLKHFIHEIGLVNYTEAYKAGKMLDILLTTKDWGAAEDEMVYNSNTYFIMTENTSPGTGTGLRIAVPKY